ncbi:hypothetical protein IQ229_07900 [Nostoc cf. edaphicum LEGE 07299]|uniref:Uncharacterized protein n=1 Tax=Nostoc cf. edaphicum LEGE 07299 TaxID=2777974 RepID=A0ABR9TZ40_9NOSO|nr:hypothetical protein [Nostoc edaphicum]MBE9104865.1 hypothetical protein [Nostoc cf. edaphicum LEGE 07299]
MLDQIGQALLTIDYTFWLNIIFAVIGGILLWLHFKDDDSQHQQHGEEDSQLSGSKAGQSG